jgi:hypothetical protein|mmetsp:Transcript_34897/g.58387  ORF Transcript_34897/g.58387 Transcript_34897/m.58387 type:complete len:91 (+) Transcript_34897:1406-1678(+)
MFRVPMVIEYQSGHQCRFKLLLAGCLMAHMVGPLPCASSGIHLASIPTNGDAEIKKVICNICSAQKRPSWGGNPVRGHGGRDDLIAEGFY